MFALMGLHINKLGGFLDASKTGLDGMFRRTYKGHHRTVVVGIHFPVKKNHFRFRCDFGNDFINHFFSSAFGEIRNTFN
jgi:hypothetical protein